MNWILKNKNKKNKTLLVVLFLVFGILFSSNLVFAADQNTNACQGFNLNETIKDSANVYTGSFSDGNLLCTCFGGTKLDGDVGKCIGLKAANAQACKDYGSTGSKNNPDYAYCYSADYNGSGMGVNPQGSVNANPNNPTGTGVQSLVDKMSDNPFATAIKYMLVGVLSFCGWLFGIAATLFAWVIDPTNISGPNGLLQKQAVKDVWIMVRDLLNLSFILILLFGAFCTIFQVDSWNLKKIWLNILINALLVNFSFPIARFIIDISNVMFYYFVNHLFSVTGTVSGSSIFASLGGASEIGKLFTPQNYSQYDITYLIAVIIFTFVMGMTILMIAVLFVIRLIALTMLIMFSPIGFVGYIFPGTRKYADKWWSNLVSYSFFAPIMIFGIAIALRITDAIGKENFNSFLNHASANVPQGNDPNWIASAAFVMIPVFILWGVMGIAKSFGIEFADKVVSTGKKWGGAFANMPLKATGISGGVKLGWDSFKKKGPLMGSNVVEERAARIGRLLGDKTALREVQAKRIKESSDKYDMANMTEDELRNIRGSKFDNAAAMVELANRNRTQGTNELDVVRNQFGENSQVFRKLQAKVKTYDPASAFAHLDPAQREARIADFVNSNQFKAKDLSSGALSVTTPEQRARNAEALTIAFREQDISAGDIEDLRKKNVPGVQALIADVANSRDAAGAHMFSDVNHANLGARNREVQLAHLAQTGRFSAAVSGAGDRAYRQRILREGNEKTLKRIDDRIIDVEFLEDFENNVSQAKLVKILPEMAEGKPDSARRIMTHLRRPGGRHEHFLNTNPILAALNP